MTQSLVLASGSEIRASLLKGAAIPFTVEKARIDEAALKAALLAEGAPPRDLADKLAEMKALRVSSRTPGALVLGCDQVLALDGAVFSKPESPEHALDQLTRLSGRTHQLLSAAVVCLDGEPIWRHVGVVRLDMAHCSEDYLRDYVDRNWDSIRHSVGGYKLEEEGVRLFVRVMGDYFTVLGLPLVELINWLVLRGDLKR
ncbi:Maf family protein [Limimaricola hongkongensis]|uniref:Nucleoside triphosphate pyrophosphatase n=1 Tax=Limimaricola hongkongensis DSM 17492 TaxID=1122180 RepID=A0A017HFN0_9RHOB|nr:nucleoside triphosphate pyrophosphatase [Limimaricola hongkongensis]EYD73166.1 Septum formation protein Maf [Limimaricola hongkongensis DSM 17492]